MSKRVEIVFIQRKARKTGNYSVEFIFDDVRNRIANKINARILFSKYESAGLFKRMYNCFEAALKQGEVNHVTGDVNYVGILLKPKRTIQTILDCVYLKNASGIKRKILKYFWLDLPVRRSRYITAISESTKRDILSNTVCAEDKIVVIPVAISEKYKRIDKVFNHECPIILIVGTAPNKNIPRFIEACKGIACSLRIVGKKNEAHISLLEENKIDYKYLSSLTEDEMMQQYEKCDMLLFASTYEGFGMPILEAQTVGRPVITSNISSMPEVAGEKACLVDPFDANDVHAAIKKVISDKTYREQLIVDGFENIKKYNADTIALQYLELYQKVDAS
jgi:glycosyltransferase involved in cell wall biosynthesis